jgi:hypothetical protein
MEGFRELQRQIADNFIQVFGFNPERGRGSELQALSGCFTK